MRSYCSASSITEIRLSTEGSFPYLAWSWSKSCLQITESNFWFTIYGLRAIWSGFWFLKKKIMFGLCTPAYKQIANLCARRHSDGLTLVNTWSCDYSGRQVKFKKASDPRIREGKAVPESPSSCWAAVKLRVCLNSGAHSLIPKILLAVFISSIQWRKDLPSQPCAFFY